jgi:hypothetical protein
MLEMGTMLSLISAEAQEVAGPVRVRSVSYRTWICKFALLLTILLIGGEVASRVFWTIDRKTPLLARKSLWYAHYPQLRTTGVEYAGQSKTAGSCDVLILGGSTISEDYGSIGKQLGDGLQQRWGKPVRVAC